MLPTHLAGNHATGLLAHQSIAQFEIGDLRNFVYLILDWPSRTAALVDPQKDLTLPLSCLRANGFKLGRVLLTHSHHDHIAGVQELARAFPEVPISVHPADLHRLPSAVRSLGRIEKLADGNVIQMGRLEIEVMHTPGHSAGECCYFVRNTQPPYLLSGDTIFVRDCGRTDFPDGSNAEMFDSLQRIKKLPAETVILPGHHYTVEVATTLERELAQSPPFNAGSVSELEALP
jgi:glyoxylase-like metal-dependent hydrolase (beta-lactamase superfamily II)